MLPVYSEQEKKQAERAIYSHIIKDYNSCGDLGSAIGMTMPKDLRNAILYESTFEGCTWGESDWTDLSGNGCSFSLCDFYSNHIHNAALQHSLFDSAVLHHCDIRSSNFAYSLFTWSVMNDCTIEGSAFTGAVFNHVTLSDCQIAHSNFELCSFHNCTLQNINFRNLALKYTFFNNVHMENVTVPLMQMPYTFGGLKYVFSTKDDIKIASMCKSKPCLSVEEYGKLLPKMIIFFSSHDDFFPLANCYMVSGQREFAEQANEIGIVNSATLHNFRKLYFFCVQAVQELQLAKEKRSQLYEKIYQLVTQSKLSRGEYYEFRHYFPLIKHLMFDNPNSRPTLAISLHTNIAADDFRNLGLLMRTLDEVAEKCGVNLDSKHIEIRHNSPNILGWFPTGEIDQLVKLLQSTWVVIYPVLSEVLQSAANVATLITGGTSIHAAIQKKKAASKGEARQAHMEVKHPLRKQVQASQQNISTEQIEVLRLRTDLLKREKAWKKSEGKNADLFASDSDTIKDKFYDRTEELKQAGIYIESIEVQLLDDHCDTLDLLYNNEETFA